VLLVCYQPADSRTPGTTQPALALLLLHAHSVPIRSVPRPELLLLVAPDHTTPAGSVSLKNRPRQPRAMSRLARSCRDPVD